MRLLLDQNLSPRLVGILAEVYPECMHVHAIGMDTAPDSDVWRYAAQHGYTIVSKDADFHQRSLAFGAPPKVIWLRTGNCSVAESARPLREQYIVIRHFLENHDAAFLVLS